MDQTTLSNLDKQVKDIVCSNVAIFVDFDNVYYGLKDYGVNLENDENCIFSLMNKIYSMDKIRTMRAYADYDQVKISFKYLQEKRVQIKNVYGNGKEEEHRKNASDIELSIDALDTYYRDGNIDTFVFVTSDSDMIPIMSRLAFKGKKIHLYYLDAKTSQYQHITEYCHLSQDLLTLLGIDEKRKNPDYWIDAAKIEITKWYDNPKNASNVLGGKWLNDLFCDNLYLSKRLSSDLIALMIQKNIIKEEQTSGKKGFKIVNNN